MSKNLYVGNLPYSTTDGTLQTFFEGAGFTVTSARVITDRETGRSRGFGFVEVDVPDANEVISALNGQEFEGRKLNINEAREREPRRGGGGGGGRDNWNR